jgi:hypothetical protein
MASAALPDRPADRPGLAESDVPTGLHSVLPSRIVTPTPAQSNVQSLSFRGHGA